MKELKLNLTDEEYNKVVELLESFRFDGRTQESGLLYILMQYCKYRDKELLPVFNNLLFLSSVAPDEEKEKEIMRNDNIFKHDAIKEF